MTSRTRAEWAAEAAALEQAGGLWDAPHVAALFPVSLRSVYSLPGLPRVRVLVTGTKRPKIGYPPAEVRAYFAARQSHSLLKKAS